MKENPTILDGGGRMERIDSMALGRAFQRMSKHSDYPYTDGCVVTPHGIVEVYWYYGDKHPMLRLEFVAKGKLWTGYRYKGVKQLTSTGIARIAHNFAKDMSK